MNSRKTQKLLPALAAMLLTSCSTASGLSGAFLDYNEGVARASDQALILNAVRAAERKQVVYTRFSALRGQASGSFTAGLPLPFGPRSVDNFVLSPSLSVSGTPGFDIAVMDDQEFWRGITTPVDGSTLQFFLDQNWSMDLLGHLVFEEIRLSDKNYDALLILSDAACDKVALADFINKNSPVAKDSPKPEVFDRELLPRCAFLSATLAAQKDPKVCAANGDAPYYTRRRVKIDKGTAAGIEEFRVYDNRPDAQCLMTGFQEVLTRQLILLLHPAKLASNKAASPTFPKLPRLGLDGAYVAAVSKAATEGYSISADARGHALKKTTSEIKFFVLKVDGDLEPLRKRNINMNNLELAKAQSELKLLKKLTKSETFTAFPIDGDAKPADGGLPAGADSGGTTVLRSPNAIVYYLGEVIRAKYANAPTRDWTATGRPLAFRFDHEDRPVHLFDIDVGGTVANGATALNYEGETFWLPTERSNRGSQVLAFATQLLNLYKKADKAPATQAVTIVGQ